MDTGSLFTYSLLHKTQGSSCWRAQCTGRHRTGSNIGVRLSCCKQACGTLQCLTSHCSIAGRRHSSLSAPCQHHPHRREWHWWHQNLMPNMFKAWNQDGQWHSFWVPLCHFIRPALQQRIYRCDVCRVQLIVRIVQCYESRTIPWKRFHQKKLRKNKERKFERRIKTELIHERCDGAPHAPLIRLRSFGQKKLIGFLQAKSFFFFVINGSIGQLTKCRRVVFTLTPPAVTREVLQLHIQILLSPLSQKEATFQYLGPTILDHSWRIFLASIRKLQIPVQNRIPKPACLFL